MAEQWNCGGGRAVTKRAVTASGGCDDFFHDDDGSVCGHIKAPAPPERLTPAAILGDGPHRGDSRSLREYVERSAHGVPPDRACLAGSDDKWSGYLLGVDEAIRAAEEWVAWLDC